MMTIWRNSDVESRLDSQVLIVPPELLVKCLLLIAPAAMGSSWTYSTLIFCAHHPCLVGTSISGAVWKVRFAMFLLLILYKFYQEEIMAIFW